jgi:hypothetical protein
VIASAKETWVLLKENSLFGSVLTKAQGIGERYSLDAENEVVRGEVTGVILLRMKESNDEKQKRLKEDKTRTQKNLFFSPKLARGMLE